MKISLILATTAAVATKQECNTQGYDTAVFSAGGLAGAEKAYLFFESGGAWVVANDESGVAIEMSVTKPIRAVMGGLRYAVTKDATVGAVQVEVDLKQTGYSS